MKMIFMESIGTNCGFVALYVDTLLVYVYPVQYLSDKKIDFLESMAILRMLPISMCMMQSNMLAKRRSCR